MALLGGYQDHRTLAPSHLDREAVASRCHRPFTPR
jgi:hypothetical protein